VPSSISVAAASGRRRASARRRPGRPAGADGDATRRALLDAALEAFAEHGYEAMSVRDLARRVGVSHNLVHHHHGAKRALWEAALEHGFSASGREVLALADASREASDWGAANRAGIAGALRLFAARPALAKILADESSRGGERLDFLYARCVRPFVALLERLLDGAPGAGGPAIDARAAILFLFAGMTAPFALEGLAGKLGRAPRAGRPDLERYATTVAELVAHGLARPARSKRGREA